MKNDIIQSVKFFGVMTKDEILEKVKLRYYVNSKNFEEKNFNKAFKEVLDQRLLKCNKETDEDKEDWFSSTKYYK